MKSVFVVSYCSVIQVRISSSLQRGLCTTLKTSLIKRSFELKDVTFFLAEFLCTPNIYGSVKFLVKLEMKYKITDSMLENNLSTFQFL